MFTQIVESGSLSGAARALGMPANTVGRRLAALEERLAALDAWWETAAAATFEAVGACAGAEDSRAGYGSWVELFLAARAVFGEHKDWKRSCAALERRAKSESKKVATARRSKAPSCRRR